MIAAAQSEICVGVVGAPRKRLGEDVARSGDK